MLRDAAVVLIQNRLGQRTDLSSLIIGELQLAQTRLEESETLPWFLKVISSNYTGVNPSDALPNDYLREDESHEGMIFNGKTWEGLKRDDFTTLSADEDFNGVGEVKMYAIYGDNIYWFPSPQTGAARRIFYYAKDAQLTSNIENKWLKKASGLLIAEAGLKVARTLRDVNSIQLFQSDYDQAMASLVKVSAAAESYATVLGA